jgi:hypothetical protein
LCHLVRHQALGANLPRRSQRSRSGRRSSEDIKADPGAGVPATSGVEPYSAAALDGGRWCETNRRIEGTLKPGWGTGPLHTERRTASVWPANGCVWPSSVVLAPSSMGSVAVTHVMKGFITAMMNPLTRVDAALINLTDFRAPLKPANQFPCDEPLMVELMNP